MPAATPNPNLNRSNSNSSSGNGSDQTAINPIPPSRSRKMGKHLKSMFASSVSPTGRDTMRPGRLDKRNFFGSTFEEETFGDRSRAASPGEIVPVSGSLLSLNTDSVSGKGDFNEEFRELSAADLIIVIDLQQKLLDKVNSENRDLQGKVEELRGIIDQLDADNSKLKGLANIRQANENADAMLENLKRNPSGETNFAAGGSDLNKVLDTLTSQLNTRQAELDLKEQMLKSVEENLVAAKLKLINQAAEFDAKLMKNAEFLKLQKNAAELEETIQNLSSAVTRLKSKEEDLFGENMTLKEKAAKLAVENHLLEDQLQRKQTELFETKSECDRNLKNLRENHRLDSIQNYDTKSRNLKVAEKRIEDLEEILKEMNMKMTNERLFWESERSKAASFINQLEAAKLMAAESIGKLQIELTETKMELSNIRDRFAAQRQRDQDERDIYSKKLKYTEDRLILMNERLRDAESGWSAAGFQNVVLAEELAAAERRRAPVPAESLPKAPNSAVDTRIKNLESQIGSLLKPDFQPEIFHNLETLFDNQCRLTEKCLMECQNSTERLESSRKEYRTELQSLNAVNQDLCKKYDNLMEINSKLLTECHRLQSVIL